MGRSVGSWYIGAAGGCLWAKAGCRLGTFSWPLGAAHAPRETQTTRADLDGGIAGTRMNIIAEIVLDLVDPSPTEDHT